MSIFVQFWHEFNYFVTLEIGFLHSQPFANTNFDLFIIRGLYIHVHQFSRDTDFFVYFV
jgi:hypothetical protein